MVFSPSGYRGALLHLGFGRVVTVDSRLLEREAEIARLTALVDAVRSGSGVALGIEPGTLGND